jgi:NADH-quinone oxidoreductase subunit N
MSLAELARLLPLIGVGATTVVVMLVVAFYRHHLLTASLTLIGLAAAFLTLWVAPAAPSAQVTSLLVLDGYARFYLGLIVATAFGVTLLAYDYLEARESRPEEFYLLLLLATLGSGVLVASSHFASFFLGLETLSIALYALIAYPRVERNCIEAGLKYLVLAAVSAAFLLYGMALIYAQLGTMELSRIAQSMSGMGGAPSVMLLGGFGMLLVGIGYKLALVPFHMWAPDVYQGAPAPVAAFLATVSKGAMFALLLRYFAPIDLHAYRPLFLAFSLIAIASMLTGNLLALLQENVKRLLAYSSIAHLGYLLVAFLAGRAMAGMAVAFYLVSYFIASLGAFGVITVLSSGQVGGRAALGSWLLAPGGDKDESHPYQEPRAKSQELPSSPGEAESIEEYRGLFWQHPWLAGIFTAMLLSLAGLPITAGFVGKVYLLAAGVGSSLWLLAIVLALTSTIGLFYYLRLIVAMYTRPPVGERAFESRRQSPDTRRQWGGALVLGALVLLLVGFGVYPAPLIHWIQVAEQGSSRLAGPFGERRAHRSPLSVGDERPAPAVSSSR